MMTYVIIFVTTVVSILCFQNHRLLRRLALDPWMVWHKNQWERLVTHGFVHADYTHLLVNMFVLWSFGLYVESIFRIEQQGGALYSATLGFLLLYFGGMVAATLYDVFKRRNVQNYTSVGASGAVSAMIFCSIFFGPMKMVYFFGILPIPGIVFGVCYLFYERYMARRQNDNINHYAHILGAIYGFLFPLLIDPLLIHTFLAGFRF